MASTVNKCTTDMKLLKFINDIYSPYNKANSAKPHKKIIMHHHHKQSNQNSSTKSKEKYTSITSSFQSVQCSITKKMQTYLNKYNSNVEMYNMKVINNIIFEEQRQIVSRLRNILLWDQSSEFLKRFYHIGEIKGRLPQITNYYETYTLFSPVYFGFEKGIVKIMLKHVKRKKKYLEYIEDNEDRKYYNEKEECNDNNMRIQCDNNIINPNDIEDGSRCCCGNDNNVNKSGHSMYKEFAYFVNCVGHKGNDIECGSSVSNSNMIITNEDNNMLKQSCLFDITNNYGIIRKISKSNSNNNNNNNSHNNELKQTKVIEIKKLNFKNLNFVSKKNTTRHKHKSKEHKHTNTSKIPKSHQSNTTSTTITSTNNNNTKTNKRKPSFPKDKLLYQPIRKFLLTDRLSLCKHPSSFILPPNSTKHNNNNNKYLPKKQRKHKPQVNLVIPNTKPRKSFTLFHETKSSNINNNNNNNLKLNLSKPRNPYKPSTTMKIQQQQPITFLNSSNTTIIQPKPNKHKHHYKPKHFHIITSPLQSTITNISHNHTSSTNKKHKSPPYDNIPSSTHKTHKTTNSLKTTKPIPSNNSHSTSTSIYTNHFKTNLCTLKLYTKTKDKISYDFNTNNCSRSITQKRLSNNKTKKVSRNENPKNKIAISLLHTTHNKCRHLVLPVSKDKAKKKIHHHDKSITLGLIQHEKSKQSHNKRYPLTSRNEKESITIELINKLLIIRNK